MKADFSGWATKAGLVCADGRTIMPGAFRDQNMMKVPLVWQHGHDDVKNVLGHAILENRDDGVYAYCFWNETENAKHARIQVEHGDITMFSIWANQLVERSKRVYHGAIKEVSLVLSGANPGAKIDNVTLQHGDAEYDLEDDVIIHTGLYIEHSDEELEIEDEIEDSNEDEFEHAESDDETEIDVAAVYKSMNDDQQKLLHYMLTEAMSVSDEDSAQHDDLSDDADIEDGDDDGDGID
jgi:hypothetical protein